MSGRCHAWCIGWFDIYFLPFFFIFTTKHLHSRRSAVEQASEHIFPLFDSHRKIEMFRLLDQNGMGRGPSRGVLEERLCLVRVSFWPGAILGIGGHDCMR